MARWGTSMAVLVLAMSVMGAKGADAAPANAVATLVLHIADFQCVDRAELRDAQRAAEEVYTRIGVRLVWTDGSAMLAPADGALHLDVIIVNRTMTDTRAPTPGVLGHANREARRAYVYYPRVEIQARQTSSARSRTLGYVLAHEIGHLLLDQHGHATTGLMREHCGGRIVNLPDFTANQRVAIQRRLSGGD